MNKQDIIAHYKQCWKTAPEECYWTLGPVHKLPGGFCVLEFSPGEERDMWTYATCGMSLMPDKPEVELHIFSRDQDRGLVEILYFFAYYHTNTSELGLHHTLNIGQPLKAGSQLDHALISLPYLDGPKLETLGTGSEFIKFYWLIPITAREKDYTVRNGILALEERFESANINYSDPYRESVV